MKDLGLLSLEKRRQRMHLIAVLQNLNKGYRGETWDTSNRTKASGGQLQEDKVWLNRGTMRIHRKPSSTGTRTHKSCESSSLETSKIQLHKALSYLIKLSLAARRRLDKVTCRGLQLKPEQRAWNSFLMLQ